MNTPSLGLRALKCATVLGLAWWPRIASAQVVEQGEAGPPITIQPVEPINIGASPAAVVPAPVRPHGPTEVHFLGYRGTDHYTVHVGGQQCTTPCTLYLRPGATRLRTTGFAEFEAQFVVPHLAAQVRIDHGAPRWYSTAGGVLLASGIVVGASFWAFGLACGYYSPGCLAVNFVGWPIVGVSMIVAGSILLGMAGRTPAADANRAEILDARARPRVRLTDFAFAPTERGAAALASFTF